MRLFAFRCRYGHLTEEFVEDPSIGVPCTVCGTSSARIFTPPYLKFSNTEARFSVSLGQPVSSDRDLREKLKVVSDKHQMEYGLVDDPAAWAEYSRLEGDLIEVEGSNLYYRGGQKTIEVETTDEDFEEQRVKKPSYEYAKEFLDAISAR